MNRRDPEAALRAMKPAALDRQAEDGYARRRDSDLARITVTAQHTPRTRGRSSLAKKLVTGGLATACITAGAVVALSTADGGHSGGPRPVGASASMVTARSFLLASARTAEKIPVKPSAFWYERQRFFRRVTQFHNPRSTFKPRPGNKADLALMLKRNFVQLSAPASVASTEESWLGRGNRSRTVVGLDLKVAMPPSDLAAWRALGSPPLGEIMMKPKTTDYTTPMRLQIGTEQVTMAELAALPTDADRLEIELRHRYVAAIPVDLRGKAERTAGAGQPSAFSDFLWTTAEELLGGPITPGTRAALYRVLARQPDVEMLGATTDPLGRHGVAISLPYRSITSVTPAPSRPQFQRRLVIDPHTAQLLASEQYQLTPGTQQPATDGRQVTPLVDAIAYEATGWTDRLGERP